MKNIIIGIIGAIGTGKTLSAVYLSYIAWRYNNFIIMSNMKELKFQQYYINCLLYTSPSPRDRTRSRMPSSA